MASNDIAKDILKHLTSYTEEVEEALDKAIKETARKGVRRLRELAPKKRGDYAKSMASKRTIKGQVLHAKSPHYRLTHLTERGHRTKSGKMTRAKPHFAIVEKEVTEDIVKKFEEILK